MTVPRQRLGRVGETNRFPHVPPFQYGEGNLPVPLANLPLPSSWDRGCPMSVLAVVRPDSWNFPLFLHVLGAMVLVGGLFAGAGALACARGQVGLLRLGYWSLLAFSLPGWVLMRIGAEWIYRKERWDDVPDDAQPDWLRTGAFIADTGGLILFISLILGGVGVYRLREGKRSGLLRATLALAIILLAAYLVAVWAMAGKPG
jgi:hypothetical protein